MRVTQRRRHAVAGTGHRAWMYIDAILGEHADAAELVAWCEPNPTRADYYDAQVAARGGGDPLPRYTPGGHLRVVVVGPGGVRFAPGHELGGVGMLAEDRIDVHPGAVAGAGHRAWM